MELAFFEKTEFGDVRTYTEEDGTMLFCGTDIAKVLGYDQPHKAVKRHCDCKVKRRIPHPQSPDKQIEMTFIPEPDVYRLIIRSKLPAAQKFEEWVFEDVLPSINSCGAYATHPALNHMADNPDYFIEVAESLEEKQKEKRRRKQMNDEFLIRNKDIIKKLATEDLSDEEMISLLFSMEYND